MESIPTDSDADHLTKEIVKRIQDGDGSAWEAFYERFHDGMLLAIRCRLGSGLRTHLQSEDILQSVMLEALGELDRFRPRGPGSLKHFLHLLVTRKIQDRADYFGAAKRKGEVPLSAAMIDARAQPEPGYKDAESFEVLEAALNRLPERMREIILLRRIDGLSGAEAARVMKISNDAARKLFSRAMARLVSMMKSRGVSGG